MKISGLPIVGYDECLMSWLVRSASVIGEENVLRFSESLEDPDFDLENRIVIDFLSRVGVRAESAKRCFGAQTNWLFPWENRAAYCLLCLQEDVASGRSPYWRKSWCYLHCPICVKHSALLVVADPNSIGLQKAWIVFVEECNGKYYRKTKCDLQWRQPDAPTKAVMLALRVQGFLTAAHKNSLIKLRGMDRPVRGADILAVAQLMFENFLFPRLRPPFGDGIARAMQSGSPRISGVRSIEHAKWLGCSDCNVYSRMTALILVGCVFKLFPMSRFIDVRMSLGLQSDVYSGDAFDIGRNGMKLSSRAEIGLAMGMLNGLPEGLKEYLENFINGLKRSRPGLLFC
ncbi:TniQ family protein [Metapseudomonas furukawaii]|uniref:hypothetical protein n=1 Tax=Metapseudomonas furukawaii TaxID=1149133 RepID=UPI00227C3849|nr:hypothetical protein [Pseudomonas furukawaii]WAG76570.1 TniQ family protein [Pseudomonas furukawaii]